MKPSNDVYVADVSTDIGTWSTLANLPYGISDHSVIAANGYLYVIGGRIDGNPDGFNLLCKDQFKWYDRFLAVLFLLYYHNLFGDTLCRICQWTSRLL